jgi:hypothetical protein
MLTGSKEYLCVTKLRPVQAKDVVNHLLDEQFEFIL